MNLKFKHYSYFIKLNKNTDINLIKEFIKSLQLPPVEYILNGYIVLEVWYDRKYPYIYSLYETDLEDAYLPISSEVLEESVIKDYLEIFNILGINFKDYIKQFY